MKRVFRSERHASNFTPSKERPPAAGGRKNRKLNINRCLRAAQESRSFYSSGAALVKYPLPILNTCLTIGSEVSYRQTDSFAVRGSKGCPPCQRSRLWRDKKSRCARRWNSRRALLGRRIPILLTLLCRVAHCSYAGQQPRFARPAADSALRIGCRRYGSAVATNSTGTKTTSTPSSTESSGILAA